MYTLTDDKPDEIICPPISECGIIIESTPAHPGSTVAEVFAECVARRLPGIPFIDSNGVLSGRISVKHIFSTVCIPANVHKHAHLLGDYLDNIEIPIRKLQALNDLPVDQFIIPVGMTVSSSSPLIKALALIEQLQSSYIFVVDKGHYLGTVTMVNLARYALTHRLPSEELTSQLARDEYVERFKESPKKTFAGEAVE